MSQRALAVAAGVPQSTVARIEAGSISPRADLLERILHAAGQSLSTEPITGIGVDRTLIRELLRQTPAQRVRHLKGESRFLRVLDRARVARGR